MGIAALNICTKSYTLTQLLKELKSHIDVKFQGNGFWVRGEFSEFTRNSKSGHYYGELVEYQNENSKQTKAKARCNIWAQTAYTILSKFNEETGEALRSGIKVLVYVTVVYHENFGFSLNIMDIDSNFTLGDRDARKKKILSTLEKEGIINNNKQQLVPLDYTNIAVISSETAAGKGDFFSEADLLEKYKLCNFEIYPALMQGSECANSVVKSFRKIYSDIRVHHKTYDAIVLIRGGGSQADLDAFNQLNIAKAICYMPIPVFLGLGHKRDETILDNLVSQCFDTPSKVITFIQENIVRRAYIAKQNFDSICQSASDKVSVHKDKLSTLYGSFSALSKNLISTYKHDTELKLDNIIRSSQNLYELSQNRINGIYDSINFNSNSYIYNHSKYILSMKDNIIISATNLVISEKEKLNNKNINIINSSKYSLQYSRSDIEDKYKSILSMSIMPTLERGFSLTQDQNGKYITSFSETKNIDQITITYHDGKIKTKVI